MDGSLNPFPNIYEKIKTRERLTLEDGVRLFQSTDVLALGELAQMVRQRLHGKRVYYSTNLHLNHTNICPVRCDFCAFSRNSDETDAYALTLDEIEKRIGNASNDSTSLRARHSTPFRNDWACCVRISALSGEES